MPNIFYGCFRHENSVNKDCLEIAKFWAKTTSHGHHSRDVNDVQRWYRFPQKGHNCRCKGPEEPRPKKRQQVRSNVKVLLSVLFDCNRMVHHEFLPQGRTIDKKYIHTYIINHYNLSVRIIDLVSHIIYIVCVNFIRKWRDLQSKVDSEWQSSWETFYGSINLIWEFLPEICWEDIDEEILFIWKSALCLEPWVLSLISQHATY